MNAGEFDQRVTIQIAETNKDSIGNVTETWAHFLTMWANIQTTGGAERYYSAALIAEATHKIKMRYIPGIDSRRMRLRWGTRVLDITFVDDSRQRKGELFLLAKETINNV